MCIIMPDAPAQAFVISHACHVRHENILKERVIGTIKGVIEKTNGSLRHERAGQVLAGL